MFLSTTDRVYKGGPIDHNGVEKFLLPTDMSAINNILAQHITHVLEMMLV